MPNNRTNRQRAARVLMTKSNLTYAQALQLLRIARNIPDLNDPAALAALLATSRATAGCEPAETFDVSAHQWDITIDDEIGHSRAQGADATDLWPDMISAILAAPTRAVWRGTTGDSRWKIRISGPVTADDDEPFAVPLPVAWADANGDFPLAGGGCGNPGCDDCGEADAVVRIDNTYLCPAGAYERGIGWECDECERPIVSNDAISDQHATFCSLHPNNVIR